MAEKKEVFANVKGHLINIIFIGYLPIPRGLYLDITLKNGDKIILEFKNSIEAMSAHSDLMILCQRSSVVIII